MAGDENEVRLADVVDPVEHERPQVLNPFINLALTLQCYLFDFALGRSMAICPSPDGFGAKAGKT